MNATTISWTDFSINPIKYRNANSKVVWACVKKSAGCANCYAEATARRWDRGGPFTAEMMHGGVHDGGLSDGGLTPFLDEKELHHLLHSKKISGKKVFVGDMTDLFGEWVPFEMLDRLFAVMALRPDVTFQLCTKRPERMAEYLLRDRCGRTISLAGVGLYNERYPNAMPPEIIPGFSKHSIIQKWPLPNVWLGTTCENQAAADERIPWLLKCPAAVRFLSCEPLLGDVDLLGRDGGALMGYHDDDVSGGGLVRLPHSTPYIHQPRKIDWVIVGGESGPRARPCDVAWIRSIVRQCKTAGVACFVKQLGACVRGDYYEKNDTFRNRLVDGRRPILIHPDGARFDLNTYDARSFGQPPVGSMVETRMADPKGGEMWEWPEDLRVREMPS
jgi:protein gp37